MKCKFCDENEMRDWSFQEPTQKGPLKFIKTAHFYCGKCRAHFFKDKWFTAKQWFDWINK